MIGSLASPDLQAAVEIAIDGPRRSLGVRQYTHLLEQVVLSLEEVDRFAIPTRTPRLDWSVEDLSANGQIRVVIAPRRIPPRRPLDTLDLASVGYVSGVVELRRQPEIPQLFSAVTVQRVEEIGKAIGEHGVQAVHIRDMAHDTVAVVDGETLNHARRAISISRRSFGSVQGRLDVLNARSRGGPRAQVFNEQTRRAITVRAAADQKDLLRDAWGQRVLAGGELLRNAAGQAVRLDLTELKILPEQEPTRAWEILGAAPWWTGDLSTEEFIRQARRG